MSAAEITKKIAKIYAEENNLLPFAGTDNHAGGKCKKLAGVCCAEPISDVPEFFDRIKIGKWRSFR